MTSLSEAKDQPHLLLVAEWLVDREKSAKKNLESALETVGSSLGMEPKQLPSDAWLEQALNEGHPGPSEVTLHGSSIAGHLAIPVSPLGLPIWYPARLQLSLPASWGGVDWQRTAALLLHISKVLPCAYGGVVSRRGSVLFPRSQLDEVGTPILAWRTILSRTEYGDPPVGSALDEERWSINIDPPWDFDNCVSRRRYDDIDRLFQPWAQLVMPTTLEHETQVHISSQR